VGKRMELLKSLKSNIFADNRIYFVKLNEILKTTESGNEESHLSAI
jgi:hypothetical protein